MIGSRRSNPEELGLLILITLGLLIIPLLPAGFLEGKPSFCIITAITGKHCPGCGMSRAIWAILHGDIANAIKHNWRAIIVVPILAVVYFKWAQKTILGKRFI